MFIIQSKQNIIYKIIYYQPLQQQLLHWQLYAYFMFNTQKYVFNVIFFPISILSLNIYPLFLKVPHFLYEVKKVLFTSYSRNMQIIFVACAMQRDQEKQQNVEEYSIFFCPTELDHYTSNFLPI